MSLDTIKNIIQDLSKIEYALRVENVDRQINDALGVVIIDLYRHAVVDTSHCHDIGIDKLFDVYAVMSQCSRLQNTQYQSLMDDIIMRMQKVIEGTRKTTV